MKKNLISIANICRFLTLTKNNTSLIIIVVTKIFANHPQAEISVSPVICKMKYTIARQFSITKQKFEINSGSKTICTAKAVSSKEHKGQYKLKLASPISKHVGDEFCVVEPDPNASHNYLIYLQNGKSNVKNLFGQLKYEFSSYNNYLYTIIIGRKLYKVRSCDLKDRRLAVVDTIEQTNHSNSALQCPETLFQVIDSFSKTNKTYHVTINDKEKQLGYLAIIILLDLHERNRV